MLSYFHSTTFLKTKECYEERPDTSQGTAKAPKNEKKKNDFQALKGLTTSLPEDEAEVLSSKHFKIQLHTTNGHLSTTAIFFWQKVYTFPLVSTSLYTEMFGELL